MIQAQAKVNTIEVTNLLKRNLEDIEAYSIGKIDDLEKIII